MWSRPAALRPGDVVGVCSPAGAVEADALARGAAALRALGLGVRVAPHAASRHLFMAGTVDERLRDLEELWFDPEVRAVVAARGGAGASWLLDRLDLDRMAATPKVLLGYSDLTFLHAALNARGLVTFHGPMVATDFATGKVDEGSLRAALFGEAPYATEEDDLLSLRAGEGEGRLLGGCLTILAAAAGTPWAFRPDPSGTLLFLEDVDEKPYRIDRLLFQLRRSGAFEGVRGVVLGDMKGCRPRPGSPFSLDDVVREALAGLDVPVAVGLSTGHTVGRNLTLPFGVPARLTCGDSARLTIEETAVA
ncbi:MAG TPA: LD-carboxypeptidase [Vicinamibacteria bacterium]|nr:LD-carboxypeptidase [Vicinamibacteria bacterium]